MQGPVAAHARRATRALQKLVEHDAAFGALSLWCVHRDVNAGDNGPMIACTDGRTIHYGAGFERLAIDEQVAVCAHEILHVAFCHLPRQARLAERIGPTFNARLFNVAADALVNESLELAGYKLPANRIQLRVVLQETAGEAARATQAMNTLDVETLYQRLHDAKRGKKALLLGLLDETSADLMPGLDQTASVTLEDVEWQQRLDRALTLGAGAGRGLGKVRTRLTDIPKTKTPWEVILRSLVSKAVAVRPATSFGSPSTRWLAREAMTRAIGTPEPAFEPREKRAVTKRPRIAVCVDVSGSIDTSLLNRFGGEIMAIARRTNAEVHLIVFDDGIQLQQRLAEGDLRRALTMLSFDARGGTSFVEPIQAAQELDPSVVVLLTDLCGPFGAKPGNLSVVWACPGGMPPIPPFGTVVRLEG